MKINLSKHNNIHVNNQKGGFANNIKAIWLYVNINSVKDINFIKKFKNS